MASNGKIEVMNVPLGAIEVDSDFNARSSLDAIASDPSVTEREGADTIEGLARQIKRDGQLVPCLVKPADAHGKYFLIAGFRRYAALKSLGADTIRVQVTNAVGVEADLLNIKENVVRKSLRPFELGRKCFQITEHYGERGSKSKGKWNDQRIATELGLSKSYVGSLITCFQRCNSKLLEQWQFGNKVCTTGNMVKWSALTKDEQGEAFSKEGGIIVESPQPKGKAPRKPRDPNAIRVQNPEKVKEALAAAKALSPSERNHGIVAALKWVLGQSDAIVGVIAAPVVLKKGTPEYLMHQAQEAMKRAVAAKEAEEKGKRSETSKV